MPQNAVALQRGELLTGRRALHAGRAGELVNGEKSISLNVDQADCGAICQRQLSSCHRSPTRPSNGLCPEYLTGLHCPAILFLSQYFARGFQPRRVLSRQTHYGTLLLPASPSSLVRLERPTFLGADLPMAAPTSAAEVKPLPQAAATGGAEPRATHPEKAPRAPGWVSMASGVDGASTVVFFPKIGEGFR